MPCLERAGAPESHALSVPFLAAVNGALAFSWQQV
jgi:hypothetical protein